MILGGTWGIDRAGCPVAFWSEFCALWLFAQQVDVRRESIGHAGGDGSMMLAVRNELSVVPSVEDGGLTTGS